MRKFDSNHWALILGASSGFGLATARKLAGLGMNLCLVHRDRREAAEKVQPVFEELSRLGAEVAAFNLDALREENVDRVLDELALAMKPGGKVRLLLHSIAWGNLKLLAPVPPRREAGLSSDYSRLRLMETQDLDHTIFAMGTSLALWAGKTLEKGLFAQDARVVGLTSEGRTTAWRGYAAVSAAKCALEALVRGMALEYGPHGVRANLIQAGISPTPALSVIPGHQRMAEDALARNPLGRLTTPQDVADAVCLLCADEAAWINGALLHVDGGEHVAG